MVDLWHGKPVTEMDREELIKALRDSWALFHAERAVHSHQLDFMLATGPPDSQLVPPPTPADP